MRRVILAFTMLAMPRYSLPMGRCRKATAVGLVAMQARRTRTLYGTREMFHCIDSCQYSLQKT
jgi:hypothetical protein